MKSHARERKVSSLKTLVRRAKSTFSFTSQNTATFQNTATSQDAATNDSSVLEIIRKLEDTVLHQSATLHEQSLSLSAKDAAQLSEQSATLYRQSVNLSAKDAALSEHAAKLSEQATLLSGRDKAIEGLRTAVPENKTQMADLHNRVAELQVMALPSRLSAIRAAMAILYRRAREEGMNAEEKKMYKGCLTSAPGVLEWPKAFIPSSWPEAAQAVSDPFQGFGSITPARNKEPHGIQEATVRIAVKLGPIEPHIAAEDIAFVKSCWEILFQHAFKEIHPRTTLTIHEGGLR